MCALLGTSSTVQYKHMQTRIRAVTAYSIIVAALVLPFVLWPCCGGIMAVGWYCRRSPVAHITAVTATHTHTHALPTCCHGVDSVSDMPRKAGCQGALGMVSRGHACTVGLLHRSMQVATWRPSSRRHLITLLGMCILRSSTTAPPTLCHQCIQLFWALACCELAPRASKST